MSLDYFYTTLSEAEFNKAVEGHVPNHISHWNGRYNVQKGLKGEIGVFWKGTQAHNDPIQPLAIVVPADEQHRLFGRFSQVRPDLSPLSAWCHIYTPEQFSLLKDLKIEADLLNFNAAWVGLCVAEAILRAEKSVGEIKLPACMATQSYAIGRSKALWWKLSNDEVLSRYDEAQRFLKISEPIGENLRDAFEPVWTSLSCAASEALVVPRQYKMVVYALRKLKEARESHIEDEAKILYMALHELEEAGFLIQIQNLSPEKRVKEFDIILQVLERNAHLDVTKKCALTFLAGYLATIVAGGNASLSLAENVSKKWPEILAWAYAIGGIGERITWTSSFEGLGRLVAREMSRPLRLDEPPTCDFSLDEAKVLIDKQLADPLVYLKIKQTRSLSVSLLPGVNILLSTGGITDVKTSSNDSRPNSFITRESDSLMEMLANSLWPLLKSKLENEQRMKVYKDTSTVDDRGQKASSSKRKSQRDLPLIRK